jgi:hypothetical protein
MDAWVKRGLCLHGLEANTLSHAEGRLNGPEALEVPYRTRDYFERMLDTSKAEIALRAARGMPPGAG